VCVNCPREDSCDFPKRVCVKVKSKIKVRGGAFGQVFFSFAEKRKKDLAKGWVEGGRGVREGYSETER
jgi:hypothetical protein